MRQALLAAAATLLLSAPASAAVNLVSNGSFEDALTGWTIGGDAGAGQQGGGLAPVAIFYGAAQPYPQGAFGEAVPQNDALTNSPDAAGARAAYFVTDQATNQSLTQSVWLTAGTYQIGFSVYAPRNGYRNTGDAMFSGTIAGETLANYAVSSGPATTWQTYKGSTDILVDGFYDVSFVFNTDLYPSKDVVIDQVYIIAGNPGVPEPATWAMMILGFGLVGAASRRRQTKVLA
jgi:hypothetical protein